MMVFAGIQICAAGAKGHFVHATALQIADLPACHPMLKPARNVNIEMVSESRMCTARAVHGWYASCAWRGIRCSAPSWFMVWKECCIN
jgi:hypothetical protein